MIIQMKINTNTLSTSSYIKKKYKKKNVIASKSVLLTSPFIYTLSQYCILNAT